MSSAAVFSYSGMRTGREVLWESMGRSIVQALSFISPDCFRYLRCVYLVACGLVTNGCCFGLAWAVIALWGMDGGDSSFVGAGAVVGAKGEVALVDGGKSQVELIFIYKDPFIKSQQMSTLSAHQQSLADAGSETRPPMLERGSYVTPRQG
ncbi:hypothetical protein Tco_1143339 [Tanacetum coccineum]